MAHRDKRLADRMLGGDERAFEEFFETYAPAVYRFARSRLGPDTDAVEELVQLTLTRAIAKLETYRGEAGLFAWLCTFCRHEVSAYHERRGRRPQEVELDERVGDVQARLRDAAGAQGDDPETALGRRELGDRVHATLAELPPPYGDVLEWKYLEGLSALEIAERLELSVKAAESLLTRARKAFRKAFDGRGTSTRRGIRMLHGVTR